MSLLKYAAFTHVGKVRENNEDNFYIDGKWRENTDTLECKTNGEVEGNLTASVCDGMGGEECGEVASLLAVETMNEMIQIYPGLFHFHAAEYLNLANERICDYMRLVGRRVGTTFTALEFYNGTMIAQNVGDSRIYMFRDGELRQLSCDHTVAEQMVRTGILTKEEAADHPKKHQLTQHLGIFPEEMMIEPCEVEFSFVLPGEKYLLCSDGLTDMLSDEEISDIMSQNKSVEMIVDDLVSKALDKGGKDNTTVIVIEVCE